MPSAAFLRRVRERYPAAGIVAVTTIAESADDLAGGPIIETRFDLGAVRIESSRFGQGVWLALTEDMATELRSEEIQRDEPRPVLLPEDLARLKGKSAAAIRAALEIFTVFPGSRVIQ